MWRCEECRVAYLDPRPTEASIGRAYTDYYTRQPFNPSYQISLFNGRTLKARLRLGYYNARYGYKFANGWSLGNAVASIMRRRKALADYMIRHLPPPTIDGAALLDIGCGNGAFLLLAQGLGFAPTGLEPDGEAVKTAHGVGLDVRSGTLPNTGLPANFFEQITLSHVFEHLHWPQQASDEILRLLKPGGRIWLTQPNLDAAGRGLFGEYWRGLEAPRHLCLFDAETLAQILRRAGFEKIEVLPPPPDADFYFRQSLAMSEGNVPRAETDPVGWNSSWRQRAHEADKAARRRPQIAESLTIIAWKPA
jgi:2-polyprenyl-3-methyl-5-hydroxy-6-metoxy-1,4-benzoquinol methylase